MDFKLFLKVLLDKKWWIIGITVLSSLATFFLVSRSPKIFISSAQIATGFTERNDDKVETPVSIANKFNNLTEIVNSPHCMSQVAYRLVLNDLHAKNPFRKVDDLKSEYDAVQLANIEKIYKAKYDSLDILYSTDEKDQDAIKVLKALGYEYQSLMSNFNVSRVPNSDYVEIKYSSENPKLSAFAVNVLSEEIGRYFNHVKAKKAQTSLLYYSKLLLEKKQELDSKIDSLNKYKESNDVTDYGIETQSKLDQAARLELSREDEYKRIQALKRALQLIKKELNKGGIQETGVPTTNVNSKIYELKGKISDLNNRYVITGMKNRTIKDSLNLLRGQLENQINSSLNDNSVVGVSNSGIDLMEKKINTEIELEIATENLASIENSILSLRGNISNFANKETSISRLELAVSVAKEEFIRLSDKCNAAKNATANSGNIHQTELGLPADRPQPTKTGLLVSLAGVISFTFGIVLVFILEYLDLSIKTPSNFLNQTDFLLLGSIQKIGGKKNSLNLLLDDEKGNNDAFGNQLRKIRFQIEQSGAKTFLFVSTQKGQGKSFTILALANSLSLNNKKVLIIDSNLRENTLSKVFSEKVSIKKYINDQNEHNDLSVNGMGLITQTGKKGIDLLASKHSLQSPAEFFAGRGFESFLSIAKQHYDFILMESSDLNNYPDAYEFAIYADKVVGIFAADAEIKNVDKRSFDFLTGLNGKFAGAILNRVEKDYIVL